MKLEDQVCTLEQAMKLKELGVRQFGNFFYTLRNGVYELRWGYETLTSEISCHAFTVSELGHMMPNGSSVNPNYAQCISYKNALHKGYCCAFQSRNWEGPCETLIQFLGVTEAEARAAMLIHLLEAGIITAKQVNDNL